MRSTLGRPTLFPLLSAPVVVVDLDEVVKQRPYVVERRKGLPASQSELR